MPSKSNPNADSPRVALARLVVAASEGDLPVVKAALKIPGIDPRGADSTRRTALMAASLGTHVEIVELLAPLSDVNARGIDGVCALSLAAFRNHRQAAQCTRILLSHGANPFWQDADGATALLSAAESGSLETTQELLCAQSARMANRDGHTPLMAAAGAGASEKVRLLLPLSDALAKDRKGRNALRWARLSAAPGGSACAALIEQEIARLEAEALTRVVGEASARSEGALSPSSRAIRL